VYVIVVIFLQFVWLSRMSYPLFKFPTHGAFSNNFGWIASVDEIDARRHHDGSWYILVLAVGIPGEANNQPTREQKYP